jgi:hypothetical protein
MMRLPFLLILVFSSALRPPPLKPTAFAFQASVPVVGDEEAFSTAEPTNWVGGVVPGKGDDLVIDVSFDCAANFSRHVLWETDAVLGSVSIGSDAVADATCPTIVIIPDGRALRAASLTVQGMSFPVNDAGDAVPTGGETRVFLAGTESVINVTDSCVFGTGLTVAGSGTISCSEGLMTGTTVSVGNFENVKLGCQRCFSGMRTNTSVYGVLAFRGEWTLDALDDDIVSIYLKNNGFGDVVGVVDRLSFEVVHFVNAEVRIALTSAPAISSIQQLTWLNATGADGLAVISGSVRIGSALIPHFSFGNGCAATLCSCANDSWADDCVTYDFGHSGLILPHQACLEDAQPTGLSVLLASEISSCPADASAPPSCTADCASPRGVCLDGVFSTGSYCQCSYDQRGFGFAGSSCTLIACQNDCGEGGTCTINAVTGFPECVCRPSFFGVACQFIQCPNACSRAGVCDTLTNEPICDCVGGHYGPDCSLENDNSTVCDSCEHGECLPQPNTTAVRCVCEQGWRGHACNLVVCPGLDVGRSVKNCNGRGACSPGASCSCFSGWTGDACQVPVVLSVQITDTATTTAAAAAVYTNVGLIVGLTVGLVAGAALALLVVLVSRKRLLKRAAETRAALIAQHQEELVLPRISSNKAPELPDQFATSAVPLGSK